jgi:hypothetical protein
MIRVPLGRHIASLSLTCVCSGACCCRLPMWAGLSLLQWPSRFCALGSAAARAACVACARVIRRCLTCRNVQTFAARQNIAAEKLPESAFKLLMYGSFWLWSFWLLVVSGRYSLLSDPDGTWRDWTGSQPVASDMYWLYVAEVQRTDGEDVPLSAHADHSGWYRADGLLSALYLWHIVHRRVSQGHDHDDCAPSDGPGFDGVFTGRTVSVFRRIVVVCSCKVRH